MSRQIAEAVVGGVWCGSIPRQDPRLAQALAVLGISGAEFRNLTLEVTRVTKARERFLLLTPMGHGRRTR